MKMTPVAPPHALRFFLILALTLPAEPLRAQPASPDLRAEARRALTSATRFYHDRIASHGGYVYYYSLDLARRWGEGTATPDTIFVQPPGTPTVGMAFLEAYEATRDPAFLDAAREAAGALVYGQLQSGGWTQVIHFGPAQRMGKYRNGKGGSWNVSSLDDGQTQSALQFLARVDAALGFQDAAIHEAASFGYDALLQAQFPNGAFPQVWTRPAEPHPAVRASYPTYDWKTEGRVKNYWDYYTLNDNLAGSVAETLVTAHRVYKDDRFKAALARLGDFLVLAQMPDPQPGWCQQYSYEMVPIWARKFEPPAVSGWESQDALETLIAIACYTGEAKYLDSVPRALAYFEKCRLPDGRVARFYEFKTNKPLYMDAAYRLTYDDTDAPRHYGWKQAARFGEIRKRYEEVKRGAGPGIAPDVPVTEGEVRRVIRELDAEGRWLSTYAGERLVGQPKFEAGFRFISSDVFSRNVGTLSRFLAAEGK
jgi:PelA/Pel-15E family pectate lyase